VSFPWLCSAVCFKWVSNWPEGVPPSAPAQPHKDPKMCDWILQDRRSNAGIAAATTIPNAGIPSTIAPWPLRTANRRRSWSTWRACDPRCAARSGRRCTGSGATSGAAPTWASPESRATNASAWCVPAATTSSWSSARATARMAATRRASIASAGWRSFLAHWFPSLWRNSCGNSWICLLHLKPLPRLLCRKIVPRRKGIF